MIIFLKKFKDNCFFLFSISLTSTILSCNIVVVQSAGHTSYATVCKQCCQVLLRVLDQFNCQRKYMVIQRYILFKGIVSQELRIN
jgi:hypothetical protein